MKPYLFALMILSGALQAQERGDSVRVRFVGDSTHEGRLLMLDSTSVRILWRLDAYTHHAEQVQWVDIWERRDPTFSVLGTMAFGAVVGGFLAETDSTSTISSVAVGTAIGAGVGALLALIDYALRPGNWKNA